MASRKATTFAQAWLSDTAAYPIIAVIGGALGLTTFSSIRYLSASPEVHFNKANRGNPVISEESAKGWNSHRNGIRTWSENKINQHQKAKGLQGL
ncbi:hypothetical protein H257_16242 [Aphanomyces astaci]|uniref:Uncharacterized protein n=1 Tax=Aphanomyces astaci TaxID=112090 RepID=W4FJH4_APHAT|nr:hypothetical protein H257_16242 [Aphanomyces astaci]ETV67652.1 hypothetical protein H257_16242 [Aphanomyces astaci]KAF0716682.1 hypothetical protein AaE_011034 [Aphanomyces astaci]RHY05558.1 hypothetical protein DYB36_006401 [Aphanomyces astaci]RHY39378.1 hypothetical protein DYB30_007937 [Aphanomyces astaci]RHY76047.1 hypothetical protein DYB38_011923 [Aphanomyces astaci]|eukprot:XP_009842909.1 hypothetical protein H257_16242 [Aphanomyces astaci]